ncbi:hypothetical protein EZ428_15925 [Pedobacter frigiditerrae]|uniref:Uncharacterized protein n=1 Tax=Pedobacter frigiditerrae TaxID=2530452 RepID=A0A4R0MQL9_9SPHI|nr:hypothetical protein [Pedobacter frigiditerrae]TCC89189.1 hypothetical protein EZ428_15925 [Pedobacter frigiditerrae]
MNKQLTILLVLLLSLTSTYGQKVYEPQILILAPDLTKYEPSFEKEIVDYNKEIKKKINLSEREATLNSPDFKKQPENIQLISKSEIEFSKDIDFFKQASIIAESFLTYRFYEKFPNLLIKLKDAKSNGTLGNLKTYADAEKLQYVLNFASIELYKENKINYAKIKIQLYDNISNSIILEKAYIGDWNNPGFEFTCKDKTINCTLSNALSQALAEVIHTIASNSPTLKRERQLQEERFEALMKDYFNRYFDKQDLKAIISSLDSNVNTEIAYQALFNADKSKFVAFFLEQVSTQDFKALKDSKKDKNVKIISDKGIKDKGFLDDIPKTYAYIVKGVKHKDKWYHEKSNVTYFSANSSNEGQQEFFNNLQQWNFFKENSTAFNPDFWETELFEKVPDLRKDPDWEKYGTSMWKTDEINNRPYIGLYKIVANNFKKELEKENSIFDKSKTALFAQFYQDLKAKNPQAYQKISEHSLIYPTNKSIVLNPTLITSKDGKKTIHYFVILANQNNVFEWTYFEPKKITDDLYGSEVVDQISGLTDWNFSVDNLNDMDFWKKYVLLQADGKYKYLSEVRQ